MKRKTIALAGVKTAGLAEGQFEGYASVFDHLDSQGDIVRRGAFEKSLKSGQVTPLLWLHQSRDPRAYVGEVKAAEETDEGLRIVGQFDLDSDEGAAAYRQVKARRVEGLSIGYSVRDHRKSADGANELLDVDLMEISLVPRGANDRALIGAVKSAEGAEAEKSGLVLARRALAAVEETKAEDGQDEGTDPTTDTDLTLGERFVAIVEAALADARALVAQAEDEDRDLTQAEAGDVAKALRRADQFKSEVAAWNRADAEGRKGLTYIHDVVAGPVTPEEFDARWGGDTATFAPVHIGTKTTRQSTTKAKEADTMDTQYLSIGGHGRKSAAAAIVTKMTGGDGESPWTGGGTSTKALTTSGQIVSDVPMARVGVPTGRPATSLLDVISTNRLGSPTYSYLRQASRALAAAAVSPGAVKPTSAVGTQTVTNTASVIAHLSEAVDKFVLSDAPQLQRFISDEMLYGLDLEIQRQALSGDGTGANQRGILATSGIQVQAFDSSILKSVRRSITNSEALGYQPSVLVVRPEDWETIELLATTDAALAYRGVPIDQGTRQVWGLTAVLSTALPAKTALVMDPACMSIDTVGGIEIEWAKESGELFSRNQLQVRVETRIGVSIFQPAAITKVATAA